MRLFRYRRAANRRRHLFTLNVARLSVQNVNRFRAAAKEKLMLPLQKLEVVSLENYDAIPSIKFRYASLIRFRLEIYGFAECISCSRFHVDFFYISLLRIAEWNIVFKRAWHRSDKKHMTETIYWTNRHRITIHQNKRTNAIYRQIIQHAFNATMSMTLNSY